MAHGRLHDLRADQLRFADCGAGRLEVGSAYAVWTGLGAAGTAVIGMWVLGESVSALKLVSIGLILAGVIGLNLAGVTP